VAQVILEMRQGWQRGERPTAEEFLAGHPDLARQPEAALDLIYEEICLRQDAGLPVNEADFLSRFPQWRLQLEVLLRCDRILTGGWRDPSFPAVGETVGDFRLVAELGRGMHGRVFLATQPSLADRPVVLKITPRDGSEHLSLARLQHSHIVPLYTVQDDPSGQLRLLCMPYFGGITLARLLEVVRDRSDEPGTGQQIVRALDLVPEVCPHPLPANGSVRELLSQLPYVQAICWMGARLADALEYAHDRGLVHLDLKPSNVLWAGDGQPMLLDFHLAQEPLRPDRPAFEWLGGTALYMSPEQKAALTAIAQGRGVPTLVDGRSDLYSLGMSLYEALGGQVRQGESETRRQGDEKRGGTSFSSSPCPAPRPLYECNPRVSVELADLIHKCLAERPEDRYPTAAALAADLRRHLNDLPLQGVPTRRLGERWRKWRRRRPHMLPLGVMLLIVLTATSAVGLSAWAHVLRQRDEARAALAQGHEQCRHRHYAEAVSTFQRGLNLAESLPFNQDLALALTKQLRLAKDDQAATEHAQRRQELHRQADHVRFHSNFEDLPPGQLQALEVACQSWWNQRHRLLEPLPREDNAEDKQQVQRDLLDLAIIGTDLRARLAASDDIEAARRQALTVLDEAETLLGRHPVLDWERQAIGQWLDLPRAAEDASPTPRTAWEHFALGRLLLRSQKPAEAFRHLERAVELQPHDLWSNFFLGICAYRLEKGEEAILAFTACVTLAPENAICYYNRALAYTALKRSGRALMDYNTALRLDPTLGIAALNRGILHLQADRYPEAITDLEGALQHGVNPANGYYNLALVYLKQRQFTRAQECVQRALRHDPAHPEARALAERLQRDR
jgi:eukaryotic-like serine/threonine-protein kinase